MKSQDAQSWNWCKNQHLTNFIIEKGLLELSRFLRVLMVEVFESKVNPLIIYENRAVLSVSTEATRSSECSIQLSS